MKYIKLRLFWIRLAPNLPKLVPLDAHFDSVQTCHRYKGDLVGRVARLDHSKVKIYTCKHGAIGFIKGVVPYVVLINSTSIQLLNGF